MTRPVIKPWNPTAAQEEAFQSTDPTFRWLCALPKEVLRKHAGKWVAARDCQLIASADSLDELLIKLGDTDLQTVIIDRIERPAWVVYR